jgi:hypothetical protein
MSKKLAITDWRKLQQGDIILVEGKERMVVDIEDSGTTEFDIYPIKLNKAQCTDLYVWSHNPGETGWFNTIVHPWTFVRRPK